MPKGPNLEVFTKKLQTNFWLVWTNIKARFLLVLFLFLDFVSIVVDQAQQPVAMFNMVLLVSDDIPEESQLAIESNVEEACWLGSAVSTHIYILTVA
jgi:hypothetical protein